MTSNRSSRGQEHVAAVVEEDAHARVAQHAVVDVAEDLVGDRQHLRGDLRDDDLPDAMLGHRPRGAPGAEADVEDLLGATVEEERKVALEPLDGAQLRRGSGDVDAVQLERAPDCRARR